MTNSSFPPLSISSTFADIANLEEPAFEILARAVLEPNVFGSQTDRVQYLAVLMRTHPEVVRVMLDTLQYMYVQIHKADMEFASLKDVLKSYLSDFEFEQEIDGEKYENTGKIGAAQNDFVVDRLSRLLSKTEQSVRYEKYIRLVDGPLPLAVNFMPIFDLRPIMKENNTQIDELIPLIQLRVQTRQKNALSQHAFQLDRRALRGLRDALDLADTMLKAAEDDKAMSGLITEIGE